MDDPNVPSLLAAPYLGYLRREDESGIQATRLTILSPENPCFYQFDMLVSEVLIPSIAIFGPLPFLSKAWQQEIRQRRNSCWISRLPAMEAQVLCTKASTWMTQRLLTWMVFWDNMMFCELVLDYLDIRYEQTFFSTDSGERITNHIWNVKNINLG